jgi:uncharacterized protein (DUF1778 family)
MTTDQDTRNHRHAHTTDTKTHTTRLELRIPAKSKELIEQAARACDLSTSAFVLQTMSQVAEDVLRRDRVTVVPPEFYDAMIASLDAPAEESKALVDAARRSREIIRRK